MASYISKLHITVLLFDITFTLITVELAQIFVHVLYLVLKEIIADYICFELSKLYAHKSTAILSVSSYSWST